MKSGVYLKNIVLTVEVFLLCTTILLMKTFLPGVVLPRIDIPVLTGLCIVPMAIGNNEQEVGNIDRLITLLLAGFTFCILPLAIGWIGSLSYGKVFVAGSLVFGTADLFYRSVHERLGPGTNRMLILFVNGFLLFLASQCFQNIF